MPVDRTQYDATTINWARLRRYAQSVARDSPRLKAPLTLSLAETVETTQRVRSLFGSRDVTHWRTSTIERRLTDDCLVFAQFSGWWEKVIQQDPKYYARTHIERTIYGLGATGDLFVLSYSVTDDEMAGRTPTTITTLNSEPVIRSLTDDDVTRFDFHPGYHRGRSGIEKVERNDLVGTRLRHHAKGVGIFKALGELLQPA